MTVYSNMSPYDCVGLWELMPLMH